MGCTSCGTSNGVPAGCGSNGSCLTGGCGKMDTFDWLAHIPMPVTLESFDVHEVSFRDGARKSFFRNSSRLPVSTGDLVVVETKTGMDIGRISLSGELVKLQMKKRKVNSGKRDLGKIIRVPDENDLERMQEARAKEYETMIKARVLARKSGLDMKVGDVEFQCDLKKATFYYTAEGRIDFRDLIKEYAREFKVKVEMRQIGARQESGRIGGIGTCGRELCCSTWLSDFKSVSTSAARYQNLTINTSKLSGQCGRLKCCLNYELDTYAEALKEIPDKADRIFTEQGVARLQKTDIFKKTMWYSYENSSKFHPIAVEKVKEILSMNEEGKKPKDLLEVSEEYADKEDESGYTELVGHISLSNLEKKGNAKKKKRKKKGGNRNHNAKGSDQSQQQGKGGNQRNKPSSGSQDKPKGQGGRNRNQRNKRRNKGGNQGPQSSES